MIPDDDTPEHLDVSFFISFMRPQSEIKCNVEILKSQKSGWKSLSF